MYLQFHDQLGASYVLDYDNNWLGGVGPDGQLQWTCGQASAHSSPVHIAADLEHPAFVSRQPDGGILVSCFGINKLYRVVPEERLARVLIDGSAHGLADTGYGVVDDQGHIWVNEITGCRVWQFDATGAPIRSVGNGRPGFQSQPVPVAEAQFKWVYDIRVGPDGNVYVLDSRNFALRMIDLQQDLVRPIAGTGSPGYSGDGGDAAQATFGSDPEAKFDGPWAMSLDEEGNIFIGDTQNHVVRMIDRRTSRIHTIAGRHTVRPDERNDPAVTDPMALALPKICSMDYADGRLYVPDYQGDLVILHKD
jgi:hypothetical protein